MQTNNQFAIQRFVLLSKQSFIINKKMIGISLVGFVGILFITLLFFQSANHFVRWDNKSYMVTFISLFFPLGIIFSGLSFPAFRSKEKSMSYLMLPASASEKYIFEFLMRVVLYIILMPLLFWIVANFEGVVVHSFVPDLVNYKFSFSGLNHTHIDNEGWISYAAAQGFLFIFIACFTGASHFAKSPLMKTMFTVSMIAIGYGLFTFLLLKGLNLESFHVESKRIFFIKDKHDGLVFLAILETVINLSLLAIAWFRLKEKEA
jgi:hypothetical protein